jgi:hypothetical protein
MHQIAKYISKAKADDGDGKCIQHVEYAAAIRIKQFSNACGMLIYAVNDIVAHELFKQLTHGLKQRI